MAITQKGKAWEWAQSWWLLLALPIGATSFLAFLYIALRARTPKWALWGVLYFIIPVLMVWSGNQGEAGRDWVWMGLFLWIFSLVHAFRARPEFLVRLEARQEADRVRTQAEVEAMRRDIRPQYGVSPQTLPATAQRPEPAPAPRAETAPRSPRPKPKPRPAPEAASASSAPAPGTQSTPAPQPTAAAPAAPPRPSPPPAAAPPPPPRLEPVDLNSATAEELVTLPGFGPMLAQKVVQMRQQTGGGFPSLEWMGQALGLSPEFIDRLRPHVILGPWGGLGSGGPSRRGRTVDF